ncbi:MAG: hypothetical protein IJP99_10230 [Methanobrevibacter sp.]|nr:hypothetical protein [Methanobrevibacter sp.]
MTNDKFDELIEKQVQRENKIRQVREDYLNEMNELPKKQITVKLFPNTHKALKVIATAKDTTLETIATSILESRIERLDIVEYVKESFDNNNDFDWLKQIDIDNSAYDINDKMLDKGNPRKRINVKVDPDTHKKLRVISAIQDRSLDNIVGSVIEYEIGEENNINASKLMDEILDSIEDAE